MPVKVAVTGGSGFIGRRLVDSLTARGHDVRVLSRRAPATRPSSHQVVPGDLTAPACDLAPFVEGCDVVVHAAGELHDPAKMQALHVEGTRRLLDAAVREGTRRGAPLHWVQLSSVGAYGPPEGPASTERVVTELTPPRPRGPYEVTKTQSDDLVLRASAAALVTSTLVRPSNVFGAGMPNRSLRQLAAAVRWRLFVYVGRPGAVATYVHVDDVVDVLRTCATDHRAWGNVFNVSNDCQLHEMIDGMAAALGVPAPRVRLPEAPVRSAARVIGLLTRSLITDARIDALVMRTRYPTLALQQTLGWVPQRAVPDTIGEVLHAS